MFVSIAAIAIIYSLLFKVNIADYLPYLATGLVFWNLIGTLINDGAMSYVYSEGFIHGSPVPHFTYVVRIATKGLITFAHNIVVLPVVLIFFPQGISTTILLVIPGFLLVLVALTAVATVLSTIAARFRDIPQILAAIMMVLFYITPVIWPFDSLPAGLTQKIVLANPLTSLLQVMRLPLLNQEPSLTNWTIALITAFIAIIGATYTYLRFDKRLAYWV
ncbi:ABC-type polysaccharide/polyol phosphate export permease [Aurantimicrobium minutum]|nr:ABC-type polysaccharide/polyol phosphate export permease [Aurantimicrobium minutum]